MPKAHLQAIGLKYGALPNRRLIMGGVAKKKGATLQQAYDKGMYAFNKGYFDSPYPRKSILYKEWLRGFNTAYFTNLKRVIA